MDKQKRQDVIVRICCLVAAVVLWMYVRSSEDPVITSTLKYVPVEILNADTLSEKGLVLIDNQDFYINLSVKAAASIVSDLDKNKDFKLVVDLQGYTFQPGENKVKVMVKESPTGVTIANADALYMKIDVDNLVEKSINIVSEVSGKVKEGYYSSDPVISPNNIIISGPERIVNQVEKGVVQLNLNGASEDISKSLKIKLVNEDDREITGVTLNQEYVQVNVDINKGKMIKVNTRTTGSAQNNIFIESISTNPVEVEVAGDSNLIDGLSYINTEEIDLSRITDSTTLDVNLVIPEGVKIINDLKSVKVKVVVTKYKEKVFTLPLNYINLDENLILEESNSTIDITVVGTEKNINELTADSFKANVDLAGITEGSHELEVQITGTSDAIQLKNKNPEKVTVIVKKANEETSSNDNQD